MNLRAYLAYDDLFALEEQIRDRRFEPSDDTRLAPLAEATVQRPYACHPKRSLAFVKLYLTELAASRNDLDPLEPTTHPAVTRARERARTAVRDAVRCAPLDGDLWLRLAVMEYGLGASPDRVEVLYERSRNTRPFEGHLMRLRRFFAPRLGISEN